MLILIPVFLVVFAALVILILHRVRPGAGLLWLIAAFTILLAWGLTLALRWAAPEPLEGGAFLSLNAATGSLVFQMDELAWPYAFSLFSLLLGFILTAPIRFSPQQPHIPWIGSMLLAAAGYLAVTSGTIFTLVMVWMVIDILELVILLITVSRGELIQVIIVQFSIRLVGTFLALWGLLVSSAQGQGQGLTSALTGSGLFLLLAAALRLGVVPFHTAYFEEPRLRRGLATVMRLVVPVSSLALLSRIPADAVPPGIAVYLLAFTTLTALYGGSKWLTARDELSGRPYLIITVGAMATACAVRGQPGAALAWGTALVLPGGFLFLSQAYSRPLLVFLVISWLGLSGLPFTPAAYGWPGLVVLPFNLLDILSILAHVLVSIGFLKHGLRNRVSLMQTEAWITTAYSLGLFIVTFAPWVVSIAGWQGPFSTGVWWASLASTLITAAGLTGFRRINASFAPGLDQNHWLTATARRFFKLVTDVLNLKWLIRLLSGIYRLARLEIDAITRILEGEGGLLWALVLLAMIFSILRQPEGF